MKKRYLDLMEKTLSAYTVERILRYFDDVKRDGLTEHGFPRLTSNIGILIANGRRVDLLPLFLEMMEFCCKSIPCLKAANDFSVREIVNCIVEVENSGAVSSEDIARWKEYIASIEPEKCYDVFATKPTSQVRNWALFSGVSEYFRQKLVGCDSSKFIELQVASQLQWFDENGMYMDNPEADVYQPIAYDIVPRALFSMLLFAGYRGKYYEEVDVILKKAGLLTLNIQSVTGELGFGGRSNQFLHNEAWIALIFEYEAARYKREGDISLACKFKAAAEKALKSLESWLSKVPISHVKNRFSVDMKFGCEHYAYFDKYMITVASFLYESDRFCDESIAVGEFDESAMIWSTSRHFHKTFVRAGGYSLEFDTNGDPHYDSSGLGRIHKKGAPSAICLSVPFAKQPHYDITGYENKSSFSISPALKSDSGEWLWSSAPETIYTIFESQTNGEKANITFECAIGGINKVKFSCLAEEDGIFLEASSSEKKTVAISLPVFFFDGEAYTKISTDGGKIAVEYDGWICEYESNNISYLNAVYANRNGIYKGYIATGKGNVNLRIRIHKVQ